MAQMPIQPVAGSASSSIAPTGPAPLSKPPTGLPRSAYLFDPGGISGPLLRPGAVDQVKFKAQLAAAQKQNTTASPAMLSAPAASGIVTLSPAQFAALGAVQEPVAGETVIDIPAQNPGDSGAGASATTGQAAKPYVFRPQGSFQGSPVAGQPGGIAGGTGTAPTLLFQAQPTTSVSGPSANAAAVATDKAATAAVAAPATAAAAPSETPPAAAPQQVASVERAPIPRAHRGADGVWELPRLPDKDEREMLRGQKWRVVESEESRKLFLGPDGEFGWDDFVDLINPLQHIPFVNMAYRAITGDEIYGAARMVDVALGPLAGASTAIDLAFRDITGKGMADNAIAAVFGSGDDAGEAVATINTASGDVTQLADASAIRRGSNK